MNSQSSETRLEEPISRRDELVQVIQSTLQKLPEENSIKVVSLWASRGGGKTYILSKIHAALRTIKDISVVGLWDARSIPVEKLISEIELSVENSPVDCLKALFIDNLDEYLIQDDGEPFFECERLVINPLVQKGNVLIVTTSHSELNQWHEYEIRAQQVNFSIPVLTRKETDEIVKEWNVDTDYAFALTQGHPYVLYWLRDDPGLTQEEIAGRIETYFLEKISTEARTVAQVASLLPVFNVPLLRSVLLGKGDAVEGWYGDFIYKLRELSIHNLISWDVQVSAYRFQDSTVRKLIASYLELRHPDRYRQIHRIALDYFSNEVRQVSFLQNSFVSAVYHLAVLNQSEGTVDTGQVCLEWVQDNCKFWLGANWQATRQAWQNGAGDPSVVDELQGLLSPEIFDQISKILETPREEEVLS